MSTGGAIEGRLGACGRLVRAYDRDRYWSALLAPADRREALFALYAFNFEIARVQEVVSEPLLGEMRLEWWREALEGICAGRPRRHEVVEPLAEAIDRHALPRAPFDALIDARRRDLDDGGFATLDALRDYAGATTVPLIHLALRCLDAADPPALDAAAGIGPAYGLAGLLRAVPFHARRGRVLLPGDLLTDAGLTPQDVIEGRSRDRLAGVVGQVAGHAGGLLRPLRVARRARPALVGAVQTRRSLDRLARCGHDVFDPRLGAPQPLDPLRLVLWRLHGRA